MPVCDCQFYRLGPGRLGTCLAVEAAAEAVAGVGLHSFRIAVVVVPMLISVFLRFQSQYPMSNIQIQIQNPLWLLVSSRPSAIRTWLYPYCCGGGVGCP